MPNTNWPSRKFLENIRIANEFIRTLPAGSAERKKLEEIRDECISRDKEMRANFKFIREFFGISDK